MTTLVPIFVRPIRWLATFKNSWTFELRAITQGHKLALIQIETDLMVRSDCTSDQAIVKLLRHLKFEPYQWLRIGDYRPLFINNHDGCQIKILARDIQPTTDLFELPRKIGFYLITDRGIMACFIDDVQIDHYALVKTAVPMSSHKINLRVVTDPLIELKNLIEFHQPYSCVTFDHGNQKLNCELINLARLFPHYPTVESLHYSYIERVSSPRPSCPIEDSHRNVFRLTDIWYRAGIETMVTERASQLKLPIPILLGAAVEQIVEYLTWGLSDSGLIHSNESIPVPIKIHGIYRTAVWYNLMPIYHELLVASPSIRDREIAVMTIPDDIVVAYFRTKSACSINQVLARFSNNYLALTSRSILVPHSIDKLTPKGGYKVYAVLEEGYIGLALNGSIISDIKGISSETLVNARTILEDFSKISTIPTAIMEDSKIPTDDSFLHRLQKLPVID